MKIVHCLFTMETGGAQVLTVELMNEMCIHHELSLIIINNKWNDDLIKQLNKRIRIFFIKRKEGSRNPLPLIKLNLLLSRLKADIIHCHEWKTAAIIKFSSAKLVYTIHDVGLPTGYHKFYDALFAISDTVYNDVTSRCSDSVKKVNNGICFDAFIQRKQYELKQEESLKLVQVSRLMHDKKGQDLLLYALDKLRREYGCSRFTLDFIGTGNSEHYLVNLATHLNLLDHVRFIGERNREWLYENLAAYHVLIQPSRYEGFGLTVVEGFAAGLPVLASASEGPAEIISDLPGGFLFAKNDYNHCAEKLYQVMKLYETKQVKELMRNTVEVIKQKYAIKSSSDKYLMEYELLINT